MPPVSLKDREYWRPSEVAAILGRGPEFWVRVFDAGHVTGYRDGKAQGRYLNASSCRNYMQSLEQGSSPVGDAVAVAEAAYQAGLKIVRERQRARMAGVQLPPPMRARVDPAHAGKS